MSFANKGKDSKETAKLRAEYEKVATAAREASDPASKRKAMDDKLKLHGKLVEQISHERREEKRALQKVLVNQGTLKTKEQHDREVAAAKARAAQEK